MGRLNSYIESHEFKALFVERLGWDHASGVFKLSADDHAFSLHVIAQKRGFQVIHCNAHRYTLVNRRRLRTLQKQVLNRSHEHIVVYSSDEPRKQVWQWAIHCADGRRLRHREHPFFSESPPAPLLARLERLSFALDEEEKITLLDAVERVRSALDTEADLNLFSNRPWYAEQSDRLALAMQNGEPAAFHSFVEFHLPLARWGAKRWKRFLRGLDQEDAEQIATIGLINAAHRFDPTRGYQFSTYAFHWIRQACQRYGAEQIHLIRIPQYVLWSCWRVETRVRNATVRQGIAGAEQFIQSLRMRNPKLAQAWRKFSMATDWRSLSSPREPEYWESRRIPTTCEGAYSAAARNEILELVSAAIDVLDPVDQRIIRLRYGIGGREQTLEYIGQELGVTRERIRQRQRKSEALLRRALEKFVVCRDGSGGDGANASPSDDGSSNSQFGL